MIVNIDALSGLRSLPDKCARLCLTSPPYNMNLRVSNGEYKSRQVTKEFSTKYAGFSDNLPMGEYFRTQCEVISEMLRVSDYVFYNTQIVTGNKPAFMRLLGAFADQVKEVAVWDKKHGQPAMKDRTFNSAYEWVVILSDTDAKTRQFDRVNFGRGEMQNVWRFGRERSPLKGHGAVMPQALASHIICNFSDEGELVVDPYAGAGTTGAVAASQKRVTLGFEIDADCVAFANARIAAAEALNDTPAD